MLTSRPAPHRGRQGGLSIVELLVGIAVGLFVVGGSIKLFVDYLGSNRRMLLETRLNQDLRAAADLIARDLRRGAYWRNAHLGVSLDPAVAPLINPYRDVSFAAGTLTYSYDKDGDDTASPVNNESFGVQRATDTCTAGGVSRGVVQLRTAGNWQTITDPCTMEIASAADLQITELQDAGGNPDRIAELWDACSCLIEGTCDIASFQPAVGVTPAGANFANRPRLAIRQYSLLIRGRSVTPDAIVREIRETVRVRNDELIGACP